jgi:large subunit ribosomal protein L18
MSDKTRIARRQRHRRVRARVSGTTERPRLNVFRSLRHIYAQIINDEVGHTIVSASSMEQDLQDEIDGLNKTDQARVVGRALAERALSKGVNKVVFDRGGYKYHGRIKALAESSREAGLEF